MHGMHYSESGRCITWSRNAVFQAPIWRDGWSGADGPGLGHMGPQGEQGSSFYMEYAEVIVFT